jgi:hypothetical protein
MHNRFELAVTLQGLAEKRPKGEEVFGERRAIDFEVLVVDVIPVRKVRRRVERGPGAKYN